MNNSLGYLIKKYLPLAIIVILLSIITYRCEEKRKIVEEITVEVRVDYILDYDWVGSFSNGLAPAVKEGKLGYINKDGEEIIYTQYDYGSYFKDGTALVVKAEKYGIINTEGEIIIPLEYDDLYNLSGDETTAKKDDDWFILNKADEVLIEFGNKYRTLGKIVDGMILMSVFNEEQENYKYGYLEFDRTSLSCIEKIPAQYHNADDFSEGLASVSLGWYQYGFIDRNGDTAIDFDYEGTYPFLGGKAIAKLNDKFIILEPNGSAKLRLNVVEINEFYNGLAAVKLDREGRWGYIDLEGKIKVTTRYSKPGAYSERLISVNNGDKSGYIDKEETEIVPFEFEEANDFNEGVAAVQKDEKWGILEIKN